MLDVPSQRNRLKLLVGDTKISFCESDVVAIEFVHDQRQIHPLHSGMISQSLSETVRVIVSPQSNILAICFDVFPGLSSFDVLIGTGIEKEISLLVFLEDRICLQIFSQGLLNALVDCEFVTLSPFLFIDPKAVLDFPIFIEKLNGWEF